MTYVSVAVVNETSYILWLTFIHSGGMNFLLRAKILIFFNVLEVTSINIHLTHVDGVKKIKHFVIVIVLFRDRTCATLIITQT